MTDKNTLSLTLKIFITYLVFVLVGGYLITTTLIEDIKPSIRQSTEETLVDTANLLAEMLVAPLREGTFDEPIWADLFQRYGARRLQANIWGNAKHSANHRIYVTDRNGIVLLDSKGDAVGKDYSQWRDVYLTLRGEYGARSTKDDPNDEHSTVMHIAAPIIDNGEIIGVVTVAKPNRTVLPYVHKAQRNVIYLMALALCIAIAIGGYLAWWFGNNMLRLQHYAVDVRQGKRVDIDPDSFPSNDMRTLASAMKSMREELDGKAYAENYVQSVTHEFKSPLAGIAASLEILRQPLSPPQQNQFLNTIDAESQRLTQLVERLLELSRLEKRQALTAIEQVSIHGLINQLFTNLNSRVKAKNIQIHNRVPANWVVTGEPFLLEVALSNLLENAVNHCENGGKIAVFCEPETHSICIFNQGQPIPEYALPRLTERFYALPKPDTGKKSSGLGLNFVAEIAALHQGQFSIENANDGVVAKLQLNVGR